MINIVDNSLFLYSEPLPHPPLKQIRGGHKFVISFYVSPLPLLFKGRVPIAIGRGKG